MSLPATSIADIVGKHFLAKGHAALSYWAPRRWSHFGDQ